ncbi:MAG: hypothetical protein HQM08_29000 [Candidatus Riflebacteria bacterium]|nr:hypothetical protein [Candidatus Riflebacteria bacterium]
MEIDFGKSCGIIITGDFNTFDSPMARLFSPRQSVGDSFKKPYWSNECSYWKNVLLSKEVFSDPFSIKDWTFQYTPLFRRKLDWITYRSVQVKRCGVGLLGASDHKPLWADFEI